MLLELTVKNLGIIEDITWKLCDGLNVITGETGAGKSLLIDAVELLLSGKAESEAIRHGAKEAIIEGIFSLPNLESDGRIKELLNNIQTVDSSDTIAISCQLRPKGPSIIRVNGRAVTKSTLEQIGRLLVDIHGQSDHLSLLDNRTHLYYLDDYTGVGQLRTEFGTKVLDLQKIEHEIRSLESDEKERTRQEDFLSFQLNEIEKAMLNEGEEEQLTQEAKIIASAEKVKELSYQVYYTLYGEESSHGRSVIDMLSNAVYALKKLVELDSSLQPQLKYLDDTVSGITETARDVHNYSDQLNYDAQRMEIIASRLELIKDLKRKYGGTIAEILAYQQKISAQLEKICKNTEILSDLIKSKSTLKQDLGRIAEQLTSYRQRAAQRLQEIVARELLDLNMSQVKFEISVTRQTDSEGIVLSDGICYKFDETGADRVQFMVSTNPGEPARPLTKIISTGELSRFTLALKVALAEVDRVPVLVFDEIDIGVGGRSGEVIAKKLWRLGKNHQVICVTHLPQIAAFAETHFSVRKVISGERTLSILEELEEESRIREIAEMLSGLQITSVSLTGARELVERAKRWKFESN